jgi:hypothetical protein
VRVGEVIDPGPAGRRLSIDEMLSRIESALA